MIIDRDGSDSFVHIELAVPYAEQDARPCLRIYKKQFPDTFAMFCRVFDKALENSVEPYATENRTAVVNDRACAEELHVMLQEGTSERNRLIPPLYGFNYETERAHLVNWSDRTVEILRNGPVSVAERSRFETLGQYAPEQMGTEIISDGQAQIQTMWTEKLKRLRAIIDRIGD